MSLLIAAVVALVCLAFIGAVELQSNDEGTLAALNEWTTPSESVYDKTWADKLDHAFVFGINVIVKAAAGAAALLRGLGVFILLGLIAFFKGIHDLSKWICAHRGEIKGGVYDFAVGLRKLLGVTADLLTVMSLGVAGAVWTTLSGRLR